MERNEFSGKQFETEDKILQSAISLNDIGGVGFKRKAKIFFPFLFFILCFNTNAQTLQWNPDYLSIVEVNEYGFTLRNNSDITIKIEISDKSFRDGSLETLVFRNSGTRIKFKDAISREFINNLSVEIYYDLECYKEDLSFLNEIANKRKANAEAIHFFKTLFRITGTILETSDSESWRDFGSSINAVVDIVDFMHDIEENGFSETIRTVIEGQIRSNIIDKSVSNKYAGAVIRGLEALHNHRKEKIKFNTEDLEKAAFLLLNFISNSRIIEYGLDYDRDIVRHIDFDGDGILNSCDDCPNSFGYAKYYGCTKQEYKARRRAERNSVIRYYWLDMGYSYSDFGKIDSQPLDFTANLYKSSFYVNITVPVFKHSYSKNNHGVFGLDINYQPGTIKTKSFEINLNDVNDEGGTEKVTDRIAFNEQTVFAGISYNLILKNREIGHTIIQTKVGVMAYSDKIENAFQEKKIYTDLILRFDRSNFGWFLGARYQKNPSLSFEFRDNFFSIPKENFSYFAGCYYRY